MTSKPFLETTEFAKYVSSESILQSVTAKLAHFLSLRDASPAAVVPEYSLLPNASFRVIKGTRWFFSVILFPISESKTSARVDLFYKSNTTTGPAPDAAPLSNALFISLKEKVRRLEGEFIAHLGNEE